MTDHRSVEFEATADDDGRIKLPASVVKDIGKGPIRVRLMSKSISSELENRNVSEEEIERIAAIQFESREQVIKFLLSEGVLKRAAFGRHAR